MADDVSEPEIPIKMPEIPPPITVPPLAAFFPIGPPLHIFFSTLDFIMEAKFWPSWEEGEKPELWKFFPIGVPCHLIFSVVDFLYTNLKRSK